MSNKAIQFQVQQSNSVIQQVKMNYYYIAYYCATTIAQQQHAGVYDTCNAKLTVLSYSEAASLSLTSTLR